MSGRELEVCVDGRRVGALTRTADGSAFTYDADVPAHLFVARTLPVRAEPYESTGIANLPPFFAGLLPEGLMMQAAVRRSRLSEADLFGILEATGSDAIGDVTVGDHSIGAAAALDDDSLASLKEGRVDFDPAAIAGIQPKISLGSVMKKAQFRTQKHAYIAKVPPSEFPGLIENEALIMRAAAASGIRSAKTQVVDGMLISTRYDRSFDPTEKRLRQIHVEDALQLMGLYPRDKYLIEFANVVSSLKEISGSMAVVLDLIELYAFSYLVGNGDLHGKNVSLMLDRSTGVWTRTPVYDVLSTLPYPDQLAGFERMALALDDEQFDQFDRSRFVAFGARFGVAERATAKMLDRLVKGVGKWVGGVRGLPYDEATTSRMVATIMERAAALS